MENRHKWNEEEVKFLIENYPTNTRHYCAEKLNLPLAVVVNKIQKLKLKKKSGLDFDNFIKINSAEMAYILGYMWADGHVHKDGRHFNVSGVEVDISEIEPLFDKIGKWSKYYGDRSKYGWKNSLTIASSCKVIHKFLTDHDYQIKSYASADKILSKIPDDLKHYWFRGLIDGDGCFYYNEKRYMRQLYITSTYEQDWTYFKNLCGKLDIKYKISKFENVNKKTGKINRYSNIRILGKEILKFGDFIYGGLDFGLKRKKESFLLIKESYVNN